MAEQNDRFSDCSNTLSLSLIHVFRARFSVEGTDADLFSAAKGQVPFSLSAEPEQLLGSPQESGTSFWDSSAEFCKVNDSPDDIGETSEKQPAKFLTFQADTNGLKGPERSQTEPETVLPYDKRVSYLRISRRLRSIRVLPALAACMCTVVVTGVVCGSQLVLAETNSSSAAALLGCSVVGCTLAAFGARSRNHVILVAVVLLEVLFTLYAGGFAVIGLVNVKLLKQRQTALEQDGKLQQEQRDNALKITWNILIKEAIFSGLYFLVAVSHCYAAASANHLRAAVRPFDSRLRRKRQRARAFRKLGVNPCQSLEAVNISRLKSLGRDVEDQDGAQGTPDLQRSQSHELLKASGVFPSNAEDCERTSLNKMHSHLSAIQVTSFREQFSNTEPNSESTLVRKSEDSL
ncbi:hypothetical protein Esti_006053 [Eimeria stiedai]